MVRCTLAVRSVRYSTLPALDSCTALATSIVTVPTRGLGILPCGPRMRPRRPTTGIMSGVAMAMSKSVKPSCTRSARSSAPTTSAPASSASRALSPLAKTATVTLLPRPLGSAIVPRSCSSAWRTFRPVRTWTSTDSSNFARLSSLTRRMASAGAYSLSRSTFPRASMNFFPWCTGMSAHLHAHRAGGARDDLRRLVDVVRVEVGKLALGDLAHLRLRDPGDLLAVRLAGALLDPGGLLDEHRGRRRLRDERERAVLVDRDHYGDRGAGLILGLRVERLAELHDVDAVLAQGRADGRRGGRLAAGGLELDRGEDLLRHGFLRWYALMRDQIFLTWSKPTSTGVSRPKIDTRTLSFEASWLISEISPEKSDSGPEMTLTDSPIENCAFVATLVAPSRWRRRSTSGWVSGTGSFEAPTNPVTPGVPLTSCHESSLSSMFTRT